MLNFIVDILLNYVNIQLIPRRLSKEVALSPCMFHVPEVLPSSWVGHVALIAYMRFTKDSPMSSSTKVLSCDVIVQ